MKKMKMLLLVLVILTVSVVKAQKSEIYFGDKNPQEIKESLKSFNDQIKNYDDKLKKLDRENARLLISSKYSKDSLLLIRNIKRINDNDSLISVYKQKRGYLQDQADNFIITAAGKDVNNSIKLKVRRSGNDSRLKKLTDGYLITKYADNLSNQGCSARQTTATDRGELKGIIVNNWCYEVIARVTGPANFFREFNIKPDGKSPEFTLPMIGNYTTVFIRGNVYRGVCKPVGPNIVYYNDTVAYDYKATLPSNY